MYKFTIIAIGKISSTALEYQQIEYYKKLIKSRLTIHELESKLSSGIKNVAIKSEADLICSKLPKNPYIIILDLDGQQYSSKDFARKLNNVACAHDNICFIIGGAYGLAQAIKDKAHASISLSKMTFTHIFARLILLEQIYRAELIQSNHPYHK